MAAGPELLVAVSSLAGSGFRALHHECPPSLSALALSLSLSLSVFSLPQPFWLKPFWLKSETILARVADIVTLSGCLVGVQVRMAPKPTIGGLQKALKELGDQFAAFHTKGGGAGQRRGEGCPKWDRKHCNRGLDNYRDRTTCYRCKRERNATVIPKGAPEYSGERTERAASVRARRQAPAPPPTQRFTDVDVGEEEDPIATELVAAKSYAEWARKQKAGPARDKVLAVAQKRFAEAELADKRRKPPAERLQSALPRVNHWDREWDAVSKEREASLAVLEARDADLANTGVMREEARQELETA